MKKKEVTYYNENGEKVVEKLMVMRTESSAMITTKTRILSLS